MLKKSAFILSVSAVLFAQAQDFSIIKNTAEIYSNSSMPGSAKYNGMAGSMGALGGDVSVLNSNPAGLGVFITSDVSGTLAVENNKNTTTFDGNAADFKNDHLNLGQAGGVAVFEVSKNSPWKFVNLGVNVSTQDVEDYSESRSKGNIRFYDADKNYLSLDRHAYNRTGTQSKMSVGVGGNYDNKFFAGLGLNFHTADIHQEDFASMIYSENNASMMFDKQDTPYDEQSSGFSGSIGIMGKINSQFRLGAAIETPTWWNIDRVYTNYDDSYSEGYTETRNLTTPAKATISGAFVPNKNFAINVDYSLGISKPKFKEEGDAETQLNSFFKDEYKNLSEFKVGAEYRVQQFRIRGGYAMATSPFKDMSISAYSADGAAGAAKFSDLFVSKRNTFGAGLGYDFKSFYIDAAYQNVSSEYKSPVLFGEYSSGTFPVESTAAAVSNVKNTKNNLYFTLGWKF